MLPEDIQDPVVVDRVELSDNFFDFEHEILHQLLHLPDGLGLNFGCDGEYFFFLTGQVLRSSPLMVVSFHFVQELELLFGSIGRC